MTLGLSIKLKKESMQILNIYIFHVILISGSDESGLVTWSVGAQTNQISHQVLIMHPQLHGGLETGSSLREEGHI